MSALDFWLTFLACLLLNQCLLADPLADRAATTKPKASKSKSHPTTQKADESPKKKKKQS